MNNTEESRKVRKNREQIEARRQFIKSCLDDPKQASRMLHQFANKMQQTTKVGDMVNLLSDMLYLSEETIFKDYMDCKDTENRSKNLRTE